MHTHTLHTHTLHIHTYTTHDNDNDDDDGDIILRGERREDRSRDGMVVC